MPPTEREKKERDAISRQMMMSEMKLLSTMPGAVPPHLDDGGHLPFGGTIDGTSGPSAFGKRHLTTPNMLGNPQALLLNYPPVPTSQHLACWARNYKSSIYLDPTVESERLKTSNQMFFGKSETPSYLCEVNHTYGDLRRTARTKSTTAPSFYPPPRPGTASLPTYKWTWPEREKRPPQPNLVRPQKLTQDFLEEYNLRGPWLKY